jgi:type I restriction enzyme S subunit
MDNGELVMENSQSGYKRTEIGVIPDDWVVKELGKIFLVSAGGDFDPTQSSQVKDKSHPYPVYSNALSNKGLHGFSTNNEHKQNSITVTARGTLGVANYRDHPFTAIGRVLVLEPNTSLDGRYFADFINEKIEFAVESTGVPQLTAPQISRYKVAVPPLPEQRAIAEVLSDVDALIAALDRLIAKKRAIKQGAMQQLLTGKTRLPGFSGTWDVKRLDTVAEICNGGTPSTNQPEYWDGETMWCTPTDVTALEGFKYLSKTTRTITPLGLGASSAELIPAHSIVMTSRATIGECAINTVPVATNQGFKSFVPFDDIDVEFLYYLLRTKKHDFLSMCSGSTFPEISKSEVAAFEIEIPANKKEQSAIAIVLSDMDAEIAALEARRDKTRAIKRGMMQELLTGRIRLVWHRRRDA